MNDFELWEAYMTAQRQADELLAEVRRRGLLTTPIAQWSRRCQDTRATDLERLGDTLILDALLQ
jgi:hypothetical protein